jgi:hypothetical protein
MRGDKYGWVRAEGGDGCWSMGWEVDGGRCVLLGGLEVSLSVELLRINEREKFKEKFKVLASRIFGRVVRNLANVGSVGIVRVVVYWALR